MTSTFTPNKNLEQPANGDYSGDWNVPVNADWAAIDKAFGGVTNINVVAATGTVVLTSAQYTPPDIILSGALTANVIYEFPSGVGGFRSVLNNSSGAFTITFASAGAGTTVIVPQGYRTAIICDATNVSLWNNTPSAAAGLTNQVQYNNGGFLAATSVLTLVGGALTVTTAGTTFVVVSGGAGFERGLLMQTGPLDRWSVFVDEVAESGGNVGSNLTFNSYTDAGVYLATPLTIVRSTGTIVAPYGLILSGVPTIPALATTNIVETCNLVGTGLSGTIPIYAASGGIYYATPAATGNWIVNLSLSAGATLNSALATGQSMTFALLATQGATAYYCAGVQVDGVSRAVNWQGGSAPTSGNVSGIDVYTFTVIKTGGGAFTVLASQTQF